MEKTHKSDRGAATRQLFYAQRYDGAEKKISRMTAVSSGLPVSTVSNIRLLVDVCYQRHVSHETKECEQ